MLCDDQSSMFSIMLLPLFLSSFTSQLLFVSCRIFFTPVLFPAGFFFFFFEGRVTMRWWLYIFEFVHFQGTRGFFARQVCQVYVQMRKLVQGRNKCLVTGTDGKRRSNATKAQPSVDSLVVATRASMTNGAHASSVQCFNLGLTQFGRWASACRTECLKRRLTFPSSSLLLVLDRFVTLSVSTWFSCFAITHNVIHAIFPSVWNRGCRLSRSLSSFYDDTA